MMPDRSLSIVFAIGALVLVGSAVLVRARRGEPVWRSALVWAVILMCAFVVARWYDTH